MFFSMGHRISLAIVLFYLLSLPVCWSFSFSIFILPFIYLVNYSFLYSPKWLTFDHEKSSEIKTNMFEYLLANFVLLTLLVSGFAIAF